MEEDQETLGRKRKREDYNTDDENSKTHLHYHIKKRKTYVIESSNDEESNTTKDDIAKGKEGCSTEDEDKEENVDSNRIP